MKKSLLISRQHSLKLLRSEYKWYCDCGIFYMKDMKDNLEACREVIECGVHAQKLYST